MRFFSFKSKLLLLFSISTSLVLVIHSLVALKDFDEDKKTSILGSALSHSQSSAFKTNILIENITERIAFYMSSFKNKHGFYPYTKQLFQVENQLLQIEVYSSQGQTPTKLATLKKDSGDNLSHTPDITIIQQALTSELSLQPIDSDRGLWALYILDKNQNSNDQFIIVSFFKSEKIYDALQGSNLFDTYLIDNSKTIIAAPYNPYFPLTNKEKTKIFTDAHKNLNSNMGAYTIESQGKKWVVGLSKVGFSNLTTISLIPLKNSMTAIQVFILKSILFLGILIFGTIVVGVLFSNNLTYSLNKLIQATHKVSNGDFDVSVNDINSNDEIGLLAKSFKKMTLKIRELLSETAEKARMEEELKTAQTVQTNLFPKDEYKGENFEIKGYYKPASECSGDWYYYTILHEKVYFWIGDATGHGVPAALVTSAAKSAASAVEDFPQLSVKEIMQIFNRCIYQTSKGQVLMTFFMGVYDIKSGKFTYTNASHDPPLLLSKMDRPLKKKDIFPLLEANGRRLGDDISSTYQEVELDLGAGDLIYFYTDGVHELVNAENEMLGERKVIKTLLQSFNEDLPLDQNMAQLQQLIDDFKGDTPLLDDCTYFMFKKVS